LRATAYSVSTLVIISNFRRFLTDIRGAAVRQKKRLAETIREPRTEPGLEMGDDPFDGATGPSPLLNYSTSPRPSWSVSPYSSTRTRGLY
jgi:hypothetical protein